MQIVVTVKQVPDTGVPIEIDPERPAAVRREDIVSILNPGDVFALSAAVALRERFGGEVVAVTMGPESAEQALRSALVAGADRAVRLWDSAFADSDARATALILATAIGGLKADLVLCGRRALDGNTALVPPVLAETLGLPFVAGVTAIELAEDGGSAVVQRAVERGDREVIRCRLPAVLAVEAGIGEPRYASLPELFDALRAAIETKDMAALGVPRRRVGQMGAQAKVVALVPPKPRPKRVFTPDSSLSAEERLQMVLSGGIAQKKGDVLDGPADQVAGELVKYLQRESLL